MPPEPLVLNHDSDILTDPQTTPSSTQTAFEDAHSSPTQSVHTIREQKPKQKSSGSHWHKQKHHVSSVGTQISRQNQRQEPQYASLDSYYDDIAPSEIPNESVTDGRGKHINGSAVGGIRRVTSDSDLISTRTQESAHTANSTLSSLRHGSAAAHNNHDAHRSLPARPMYEGSPTSPTASENAGWGRIFMSAADNWLERLRNARSDDDEDNDAADEADGDQDEIREQNLTAESSSLSPWVTGHQRRSTMADIPRPIGGRIPTFRRQSAVEPDAHSQHLSPANQQRWKDLRSRLQFINFTKKKKEDDSRHDHQKSAELFAELSAGAPAAIILASAFQKDSKGRNRIPVLLEQLKVRITDSSRTEDRQHTMFRIELEYGSGPIRMKWVVLRDFRDFFALHSHFRTLNFTRNIYSSTTGGTNSGPHAIKGLPKFPRDAIPYLRGVRGLKDVEDEAEGPTSGSRHQESSRHSIVSFSNDQGPQRNARFAQNQRQSLEEYLKALISMMIYRGEANRLCRFLELSAMGIRLSVENSYHGKEGHLSIISTSSARGWRTAKLRPANIKSLFTRYGSKWFLVRHSYIVIVDSMFDVVPIDVFLVDSDFKYTHKTSNGWQTREDAEAVIAKGESTENHHNEQQISKSVQKTTKVQFTLKLQNAERKMKVLTFSEKQMKQWMDSMDYMYKHTPWAQKHRFESFAPVRYNVSAQWFVDGVCIFCTSFFFIFADPFLFLGKSVIISGM